MAIWGRGKDVVIEYDKIEDFFLERVCIRFRNYLFVGFGDFFFRDSL